MVFSARRVYLNKDLCDASGVLARSADKGSFRIKKKVRFRKKIAIFCTTMGLRRQLLEVSPP